MLRLPKTMFNLFKNYFRCHSERIARRIPTLITFAVIFSPILSVLGHEPIPIELQDVGIEEHLGGAISQDLTFVDDEGRKLPLKTYFDGQHPVMLMMAYYTCPNICHYLLNGVDQSLKSLSSEFRKNFRVVTVSINPKETAKDAQQKKYSLSMAKQDWHFLTGQEESIKKLAQELGFKYRYDPAEKEYAHAAAVMILTPEGKISRYLYGIQFRTLDLRMALLEASQGKIGNIVDKVLLFCYHYDPKGKKYALLATRMMAGAGLLTVFSIIGLVIMLRRKPQGLK